MFNFLIDWTFRYNFMCIKAVHLHSLYFFFFYFSKNFI